MQTERRTYQLNMTDVLLIVHEQRANHPILCARSPARSRSVRRFARAIPSYREADGKMCVPLRELELHRKRYGERHQRCPALNHMCNQSKLMARRQLRVTSWPGCLKARDVQPASAFYHSAKLSVCVSHVYVRWVSYYRLSKKDRK